jgi:hemerythrin-like domain-containing protein
LTAEVDALFQNEVRFHFDAEDNVLFPVAAEYQTLRPLVAELQDEHRSLRRRATAVSDRGLGVHGMLDFAAALSAHIRKEERQLFEECQRLMAPSQLAELGAALDQYFVASGMPGATCALPPRS